jgi:hypothetical protein
MGAQAIRPIAALKKSQPWKSHLAESHRALNQAHRAA